MRHLGVAMDATDTIGGAEREPPHARAVLSSPRVAGVWTAGWQPPGWAATTGIVSVALMVVAGLAAQVVRMVVFTPEQAVADYFAALTAKDAASVSGGYADLVATDGYAPPTDVHIEEVTGNSSGGAAVTVSYTVLGLRFTTIVPAQPSAWWGPWKTSGITAELDLAWPRGVEDLDGTISGSVVGDDATLHVGSYVLTGTANDVYTVAEVTIGVTGQVPTVPVTMPVTLQPDLTPRLTAVIEGYLDDCAEGADTMVVSGCPLRHDGPGLPSPEDISWTIDTYPQVSAVIGDLFPLEAVTSVPGTATVTYRQGDDDKTQHVEFDIDGEVTVTDGVLAWHPDNLTTITE